MGRNRLINGDFRINQRGYASGGTLSAGSYGHDRWKAGSGGGDYSFTQNKSDTTITIAAAKTLMQVVEDVNVEGGAYVLSWAGTAQARVAVSGGSTSGACAASPVTVSGAGAGQPVTVEFDAGTLGKVQLEPGAAATPFERVDFGTMLLRCQRYCQSISITASGPTSETLWLSGLCATSTVAQFAFCPPVPFRAPPTLTLNPTNLCNVFDGIISNSATAVAFGTYSVEARAFQIIAISTGLTQGHPAFLYIDNGPGTVLFSAEL